MRLFQGAGAAALPVLGTAIIKDLVSPARQGRAVGVILSTVGVAASIGPFLGGLIVQFTSWRIVFLVTGLTLLALPVAWRLLPEELNRSNGERFDWVGALLLGVGIASLLYGFELLESRSAPWKLAALLGSGAGLLSWPSAPGSPGRTSRSSPRRPSRCPATWPAAAWARSPTRGASAR